jgi:hypothetical protein
MLAVSGRFGTALCGDFGRTPGTPNNKMFAFSIAD